MTENVLKFQKRYFDKKNSIFNRIKEINADSEWENLQKRVKEINEKKTSLGVNIFNAELKIKLELRV